MTKVGRKFGVVALDPPAFVKSKKDFLLALKVMRNWLRLLQNWLRKMAICLSLHAPTMSI